MKDSPLRANHPLTPRCLLSLDAVGHACWLGSIQVAGEEGGPRRFPSDPNVFTVAVTSGKCQASEGCSLLKCRAAPNGTSEELGERSSVRKHWSWRVYSRARKTLEVVFAHRLHLGCCRLDAAEL